MALDPEPRATVVFRNRGGRPFVFKKAKSGLEIPLAQLGAIGLKLFDERAFVSVDLDSGVVWVDGFEP